MVSDAGPGTAYSVMAEHELLGPVVAELVAGYVRSLEDRPVCPVTTPAELEGLFDEPLPATGMPVEKLVEILQRDVLPNTTAISSPRYFGLFNPAPLPVAVWVEAVCAALNQNAANWRNAPVTSVLEARVVRWLGDLIGYPSSSFGTLTSGGSEANLIGLKCARDRTERRASTRGMTGAGEPLVVYASEQCHYSVVKSADILGLGRARVRKIDTDRQLHVRLDAVEAAIERDRHAGLRPCCIVGVAGATSSGVVDPLDRLADLAERHAIWFHVDAAYGGGLAFSTRHRGRLRGIERADSVTIDPHKWMFVPFSCGALLVRDGASILRDAFDISPEYLSERRGHGEDTALDFFRYGQLGSRRGSALTLWAALKTLGVAGYARIIDHQVALTRQLAERLDELDDFERLGEVETAVCCVRYIPPAIRDADGDAQDEAQRLLQQHIERDGRAWVATTVLNERRALRVNVDNFLTDSRHIDQLIDLLRRGGEQIKRLITTSRGSGR